MNRNMLEQSKVQQQGFTLLELLVSIAIIAIIGAITFPIYNNYIETSQTGVLVSNMSTIEVFQEDFRLRTGAYAQNLADKAAIEAAIGWNPRDGAEYTYSIAASDGTIYRLTGADAEGNSICREFPGNIDCP